VIEREMIKPESAWSKIKLLARKDRVEFAMPQLFHGESEWLIGVPEVLLRPPLFIDLLLKLGSLLHDLFNVVFLRIPFIPRCLPDSLAI
jgi:hypothetical protein